MRMQVTLPSTPKLTVFQATNISSYQATMDKNGGAPSLSRFTGKKGEFTTWKDMVYTYCAQLDTKYAMTQLEKDHPIPAVTMTQFLHGSPKEPVLPIESGSDHEAKKARFAHMHWRSARHSVMNRCLFSRHFRRHSP